MLSGSKGLGSVSRDESDHLMEYLSGHGALNTMVLVHDSMEMCRKIADFTFGKDQTTISFIDGGPNDHSAKFSDRSGPYYPRVLYGYPRTVLSLLRTNLNRSSNLRPSSGNGVDLRELEVFVLDDAEKLIQNNCMDDVCEILQICKFFSRKKLRFIILSGYILSNHFGAQSALNASDFGANGTGGEFGAGFWNNAEMNKKENNTTGGAAGTTGTTSKMLTTLTNKGQKQHSTMLRSLRNSLIKGQNLFGLRKDQIRARARRHVKHYAVVARRKRWAKLLADLHKTLSLPMGVIFFDHNAQAAAAQGTGGAAATASTQLGTLGTNNLGGGVVPNIAGSATTVGLLSESLLPGGSPSDEQTTGGTTKIGKTTSEGRLSSKESGVSGVSTPSNSTSSSKRGFKSNAELIKQRSRVTEKKFSMGGNVVVVSPEKKKSMKTTSNASGPTSPDETSAGEETLKRSRLEDKNSQSADAKTGSERENARADDAETTDPGEVEGKATTKTSGADVKTDQKTESAASPDGKGKHDGEASSKPAAQASPSIPKTASPPAKPRIRKPLSAAERARAQQQQSAATSREDSKEDLSDNKPAPRSSESGNKAALKKQLSEVYHEEVSLLEDLMHGHSHELSIHPTLDARNVPGGCDFYLTPSNPIILRAEVPKGLRCVVHFGVLETHLYGLRLMALQVNETENTGSAAAANNKHGGNNKTGGTNVSENANANTTLISLLFVDLDEADQTIRDIEDELEIRIQVIPNELLPT
ncbi:unnamed protein product [Amoebophrya sp. A120]|nr:unnamed protein product [Amoebophrya sp. A120]|eukprot:GSA120T00004767001.1